MENQLLFLIIVVIGVRVFGCASERVGAIRSFPFIIPNSIFHNMKKLFAILDGRQEANGVGIVSLKNIALECGCARKLVKPSLFNVIYFVQDRHLCCTK